MIHKTLDDKIKERAYEIYQARMETGQIVTIGEEGYEVLISELDDYLQAQDEIIRKERKDWR